jgi:hypothetical protein
MRRREVQADRPHAGFTPLIQAIMRANEENYSR